MMGDSTLFESPTKYVEWRINNFFDLPTENNYYKESPLFSASHAKWKLIIYPNHDAQDKSVSWISLYLRKECSPKKYHVYYKLGIQNDDGSEFKSIEFDNTFTVESVGYGTPNFVERSSLLRSKDTLAPDGSLSVICSVRIDEQRPLEANRAAASQTHFSDDDPILAEDFKNMYMEGHNTDITVLVKNKTFSAHRIILAARSSVFASMFQHDFAEKSSGNIEITDCDPESFDEFLLFLYTGKLNNLSSSKAPALYKTADKYGVKQLKEKCVDIMRHNLCVDSFCDVIHLATMHSESDLHNAAIDFFIKHVESILSTAKWLQFSEENTVMSNELFMKFVKSKK